KNRLFLFQSASFDQTSVDVYVLRRILVLVVQLISLKGEGLPFRRHGLFLRGLRLFSVIRLNQVLIQHRIRRKTAQIAYKREDDENQQDQRNCEEAAGAVQRSDNHRHKNQRDQDVARQTENRKDKRISVDMP